MQKSKLYFCFIQMLIIWLGMGECFAANYTVKSPNGKIVVSLGENSQLFFSVKMDGRTIVEMPALSLDAKTYGISSVQQSTVKDDIEAPLYRQKSFTVRANQLDVKLHNGFGLQLRAYNDGVAYRFYTTNRGTTVINGEVATFQFPGDAKAWLAYSTNDQQPYAMAFQNVYHETKLSEARNKMIFLPATIEVDDVKVTILESDLRSYPGMFLKAEGALSAGNRGMLTARFAHYPKEMDYYKWRGMSYVKKSEFFIAKSEGVRTYPWRVLAISTRDADMPVNNLVYALAEPNKIGDTSWIKPGKAAWDWWHDWNLRGVPFVAGINTDTYLYYIDFAARYGLEYIVIDEGWYNSEKGDLMNPIPEMDLRRIIRYARQKGIGVVLWTVFNVLDEHLREACIKYGTMGIAGFKVDFLDRNDQTAVEMAERIAAYCAKNHLILDYHGFYAPTGMSRTYPNIVNYEGVFGMEECRWAQKTTDMPRYDVTFPFIRMMAGQVDFTPGAMRNGTRDNWVECYQNPVSMGTRCHQAACYVVHDSPFTMLCDAPTSYEREPEFTQMIAQIPTVWDETRVLKGKIGEYIITARRKGDVWYVGGQTDWISRAVTMSLSFLGNGSYKTTLLVDGINANHNAEDFRIVQEMHKSSDFLTIKMASGGGFVIRLQKE